MGDKTRKTKKGTLTLSYQANRQPRWMHKWCHVQRRWRFGRWREGGGGKGDIWREKGRWQARWREWSRWYHSPPSSSTPKPAHSVLPSEPSYSAVWPTWWIPNRSDGVPCPFPVRTQTQWEVLRLCYKEGGGVGQTGVFKCPRKNSIVALVSWHDMTWANPFHTSLRETEKLRSGQVSRKPRPRIQGTAWCGAPVGHCPLKHVCSPPQQLFALKR